MRRPAERSAPRWRDRLPLSDEVAVVAGQGGLRAGRFAVQRPHMGHVLTCGA